MIVGVDLGVRSATLACLDPENVQSPALQHLDVKLTGPEAVRAVARQVAVMFLRPPWSRAVVVWIERPMGRYVQQVSDIARMGGAIAGRIPPHIGVDEVEPSVWRRWIGLPGNASKEDVARLVRSRVPSVATQHEVDACGVAMALWAFSQGWRAER